MHPVAFTPDRRKHPRQGISRPAKVYHAGSARYLPAYTRDLSSGGMLLEIDSPRALCPGDHLDIVIAWNDRTLLSEADMAPSRITRVLDTGSPRQIVGVAFLKEQAVPSRAKAA